MFAMAQGFAVARRFVIVRRFVVVRRSVIARHFKLAKKIYFFFFFSFPLLVANWVMADVFPAKHFEKTEGPFVSVRLSL